MGTGQASQPAEPRRIATLGWKRSLGAGVLLGLALGCAWLAHWTPFTPARVALIILAVLLLVLGVGLLGAAAAAQGWRGRLRGWLEERFPGAGLPYFLALVLLALGAMATGNNLLYLIVSGLLAVLIVSGVTSALNLSGMVLRFRLPAEMFALQPVPVQLTLSNAKSFWPAYSLRVSATAQRRGSAPAAAVSMPPVYFPYLPRRGSVTASSQMRFPQRGRYASSAFSLTTRFPFGLVQKRRRFQSNEKEPEVLVYPAPAAMPVKALASVRAGMRAHSHRRGEGREIYRIRPYQAGESARRMHWKATARAGELQVREFSREHTSHVRLRLALRPGLSAEAAESAISVCAGWLLRLLERPAEADAEAELWLEFVGEHGTAGHTGGEAFWLPSAPAKRQRRAVLEYLAQVEPERRLPLSAGVRLDADAVEVWISGPDEKMPAAVEPLPALGWVSNRSADGNQ